MTIPTPQSAAKRRSPTSPTCTTYSRREVAYTFAERAMRESDDTVARDLFTLARSMLVRMGANLADLSQMQTARFGAVGRPVSPIRRPQPKPKPAEVPE